MKTDNTVNGILAQIEAINASMSAFRFAEIFIRPRWHVKLTWEGDGTKLEVEKKADDFVEALALAWAEFDKITRRGLPLPRLTAPIEIEQKVIGQEIDDDIPF